MSIASLVQSAQSAPDMALSDFTTGRHNDKCNQQYTKVEEKQDNYKKKNSPIGHWPKIFILLFLLAIIRYTK